jgi:hypothetical protein
MVGRTTPAPEATFVYGAGGLTLVADRRLHGLPLGVAGPADIRVYVDAPRSWAAARTPYYTSGSVDARGCPTLRVTREREGYAFAFADGSSFWIDRGGDTIWMTFETTIEDACTYLAGPVLSFVFRLRQEFSLHASAVAIGGRAFAFAGPHAAGKSTTAGALGRRGYPVLTDDILRMTIGDDGWLAHSFGGIVRLWPGGEAMVFGTSGRLERITPCWDKGALPIGAGGVPAAAGSLPLAGIAFLVPVDDCHAITVTPLTPAEAMLRLVANSSAGYLLDSVGRRHEFGQAASIAACASCVEIARPEGAASIDDLLATIAAWTRTLASSGGALA